MASWQVPSGRFGTCPAARPRPIYLLGRTFTCIGPRTAHEAVTRGHVSDLSLLEITEIFKVRVRGRRGTVEVRFWRFVLELSTWKCYRRIRGPPPEAERKKLSLKSSAECGTGRQFHGRAKDDQRGKRQGGTRVQKKQMEQANSNRYILNTSVKGCSRATPSIIIFSTLRIAIGIHQHMFDDTLIAVQVLVPLDSLHLGEGAIRTRLRCRLAYLHFFLAYAAVA